MATQDDRLAIETIVCDAYSRYVAGIGRKPSPMLDDYAALIRQERVRVATTDGLVQGVLVLLAEQDTMLLENVAVAPAAQGAGLGRALLCFAEQAAREAGYHNLRLYTHETMTENIALYTRRGYIETHRGEEKGLRRVYMVKALRSP